LKVPQTA